MKTIDLMWKRLAQHQPFADERGYGPEWKRMCEERTEETADADADADSAWWDAWDAAGAANAARAEAAWAARAAEAAKRAERWAESAIEYINKAEGKDGND